MSPKRGAGIFTSITRQEQIALAVFFVLAIGYAVWHTVNRPPQGIDLGSDIPSSRKITVQVEGAVANPGMIEINSGASVADAVLAAGGLLPNADRGKVNYDRRLADGDRIFVPFAGEPSQPLPQLININTASESELTALPGIGKELAARIVAYRNAHGPFQRIEDLMLVEGIGQGKFEDIRRFITVGE